MVLRLGAHGANTHLRRNSPAVVAGRPAEVPKPNRSSAHVRWMRLARFGVPPALLALDLLSVAIGLVAMENVGRQVGVESPSRKTAAFAVILLILLALGGLYRSRLSLSVLDDAP